MYRAAELLIGLARVGGLIGALALFSSAAVAEEPHAKITYAKEVSRIIQDNCQGCHQPGQIGPMSFMSYEEVRPWAPLIQLKVAQGEMPPYQYDKDVGVQKLKDDWRMAQEDIDTIVEWVNQGSPFGNAEDLPPTREYPPVGEWRLAAQLGEPGEWVRGDRLSEFAFGKLGEMVPEGACRKVPADSKVGWEVHYYPDGNAVPNDQVTVGIWYYDEEDNFSEEESYPQDLRAYNLNGGGDYLIPPHGTLMTQGFHSFDHPVRVDSWQPHMHLRGVAMSLEVFDPATGSREVLSQASNWNAGWNHSHTYEDGFQPLIPAGATLILTAWYDNTAGNPRNPDPDQWVGAGQRTTDEMSHAWIALTHLDDIGYEQMLAEQQELLKSQALVAGGAQ